MTSRSTTANLKNHRWNHHHSSLPHDHEEEEHHRNTQNDDANSIYTNNDDDDDCCNDDGDENLTSRGMINDSNNNNMSLDEKLSRFLMRNHNDNNDSLNDSMSVGSTSKNDRQKSINANKTDTNKPGGVRSSDSTHHTSRVGTHPNTTILRRNSHVKLILFIGLGIWMIVSTVRTTQPYRLQQQQQYEQEYDQEFEQQYSNNDNSKNDNPTAYYDDRNLFGLSIGSNNQKTKQQKQQQKQPTLKKQQKQQQSLTEKAWVPFSFLKDVRRNDQPFVQDHSSLSLADIHQTAYHYGLLSSSRDDAPAKRLMGNSLSHFNHKPKRMNRRRRKRTFNLLAKSPENLKKQQLVFQERQKKSWWNFFSLLSTASAAEASTSSASAGATKIISQQNRRVDVPILPSTKTQQQLDPETEEEGIVVWDTTVDDAEGSNNTTITNTNTIQQQVLQQMQQQMQPQPQIHAAEVLQCPTSVIEFVIDATDGKDECDGLIRAFDQTCFPAGTSTAATAATSKGTTTPDNDEADQKLHQLHYENEQHHRYLSDNRSSYDDRRMMIQSSPLYQEIQVEYIVSRFRTLIYQTIQSIQSIFFHYIDAKTTKSQDESRFLSRFNQQFRRSINSTTNNDDDLMVTSMSEDSLVRNKWDDVQYSLDTNFIDFTYNYKTKQRNMDYQFRLLQQRKDDVTDSHDCDDPTKNTNNVNEIQQRDSYQQNYKFLKDYYDSYNYYNESDTINFNSDNANDNNDNNKIKRRSDYNDQRLLQENGADVTLGDRSDEGGGEENDNNDTSMESQRNDDSNKNTIDKAQQQEQQEVEKEQQQEQQSSEKSKTKVNSSISTNNVTKTKPMSISIPTKELHIAGHVAVDTLKFHHQDVGDHAQQEQREQNEHDPNGSDYSETTSSSSSNVSEPVSQLFNDPTSTEARVCCASILSVYHDICSQDVEEDMSDSKLFFCVMIMACCGIIKSLIRHYKILWLPEAAGCILVGVVSGYIINYFPHHDVSFDGNWFLRILVPPIIFEAALSIDKRSFNRHIVPIIIYSVAGTIVATCLTALIVHYGTRALSPWCTGIPFVEALTFGALISSIDPIAVLSVLSNMGMTDTDTIYVLIFGESLLNDGVAIVLFHTLVHFLDENLIIDQIAINTAAVHFAVVAIGSLLVGIASGMLGTVFFWVFHGCQTPLVEVIMFFCWALFPYYVCDGIGWSGIVAAVAVGFFMDVYIVGRHHSKHGIHHHINDTMNGGADDDDRSQTSHDSIGEALKHPHRRDNTRRYIFGPKGHLSNEARAHIGFVTEIISTSMETAIFAYLGFFLFSHRYRWNFFHILIAIIACCLSRAIMIPSLGMISNWISRFQLVKHRIASVCYGSTERLKSKPDGKGGVYIDRNMQIALWFAGLRGAMSFALVEHIPLYDSSTGRGTRLKPELKAMTSASIMFTVFVLGGYTYYMMQHLGIAPQSPRHRLPTSPPHEIAALIGKDKDDDDNNDDQSLLNNAEGIDIYDIPVHKDTNSTNPGSAQKFFKSAFRRQRHTTRKTDMIAI